jgi:hypothetical protein
VEEEIKQGLKGWAKSIRPPKANASDRHVQAWRWAIAITAGVNTMALAAHIALACGLITPMYAGFAQAGDVKQVIERQTVFEQRIKDERNIERQTDLEQQILQVREKQCLATGSQVKSLYTFAMQKMLVEYQKLAGSAYPLPSCGDFQ